MSSWSGSEAHGWVGPLPSGWSIRRLGTLGELVKGRGGSKEDNRDSGVPVVRYGDLYTKFDTVITWAPAFVDAENAANYSPLPSGSLLFAASGESAEEIGKSALALLDEPAVTGGDTVIFHPGDQVDPLYLAYVMESAPLRANKALRGTGFTVVHISAGRLKTLPIPLPPEGKQRAIAEYLDRETDRIDTLIAEQQRLIGMLRERRTSVVERSIALLDWSKPFKAVSVLIQTGPFGSQLKSDEYHDGGTPIINPSHMIAGEVVPDPRVAVTAEKAAELVRHTLKEGDLICARRGELGRCAVIGASAAGHLCGTGSALVRFDLNRLEPSFAAVVFGSRRNRDALALASVGSTMDNLNSDIIGALRIPVPSLSLDPPMILVV